MRIRLFTLVHLMLLPNYMDTGSQSIIVKPITCMPATVFSLIMSHLFEEKLSLPEKLPVRLFEFQWVLKSKYIWGTWMQSGTGVMQAIL